jgi:hypothetical protein
MGSVDTLPLMLDSIPPIVQIEPTAKYHNKPFSMTFKTNEKATIWYSSGKTQKVKQYEEPVFISRDGIYSYYYYAEDDLMNRSKQDSIEFILDQVPPRFIIKPVSGTYSIGSYLKYKCNEPCKFILLKNRTDTTGKAVSDSIIIHKNLTGYILALDSAGNKTISEKIECVVDTVPMRAELDPLPGIYNSTVKLSFKVKDNCDIYYTFDPLSPHRWFNKYTSALMLPHGLTIVRYYVKNKFGGESDIIRAKYVVDTIPPLINAQIVKGSQYDTIKLMTKEQALIRYTLDLKNPTLESEMYVSPIVIHRKGICRFKARAWDLAANESSLFKWEYKYDHEPPVITISHAGGVFSKPLNIEIKSSEPAKILYTLDKSVPDENSLLYTSGGITISREDTTVLTYFAIDEADNKSEIKSFSYFIDSKAPQIKVRIEENVETRTFLVELLTNEPSRIFYELNGNIPTVNSVQYKEKIRLKIGQVLKCIAVDKSGNKSDVLVMDDLEKPMIRAKPDGGVYNKKCYITFLKNITGQVYGRILPDTLFRPVSDTVIIDKEGVFSFEYYLESDNGFKSPVRRNEYTLDWTSPHAQVNLKKGMNDSIIVFFECNENATIYYCTDGSNPAFSPNTRIAGNRFLMSKDRIIIPRTSDTKLVFYTEDYAGNKSSLSILDVTSPKAIPNVPPGNSRIYDRILSVQFNTIDQSTIYFSIDGIAPTTSSQIFTNPITLLESDTIMTLVVDASGFKGSVDTFIYLLDLPPSPQFKIITDTMIVNKKLIFDASETIDKETPHSQLWYRWNFDSDSTFDTDKKQNSLESYVYKNPGNYTVSLEVTDGSKRIALMQKKIKVNDICPVGMISVVNDDGTCFCIDKYEWPNLENRVPQVNVSWVEAKMACFDVGKRLCTSEEWVFACKATATNTYPYGNKYDGKRCPTEGKNIYKAGSFPECNKLNINDMVGNAWEWVSDKQGNYPLMMGGTFIFGKDAQCTLKASGSIGTKSGDIGFRCCK